MKLIILFVVLNGGDPVEHEYPFNTVDECMNEAFEVQAAWQEREGGEDDSFAGLCLNEDSARIFRDSSELPAIIPEHSA